MFYNFYKSCFLLIPILLFKTFPGFAQSFGMMKYLNQGETRSSWGPYSEAHTLEQTFDILNEANLSEPLPFPDLAFDDEDYLPLDSGGIYFIDLNFDGQQDIVYQGMSSYTQRAIKLYFNNAVNYELKQIITGYVLDVALDDSLKHLSFMIHNPPCCDSYTHSLHSYLVSNDTIKLIWSMVIIDPGNRILDFKPGYTPLDTLILKAETDLYFLNKEFTLPAWFGTPEKTKQLMEQIKGKELSMIPAGSVPSDTHAYLLATKTLDDTSYGLVLTEPIGKPVNTLYEDWQIRNNLLNMYMGWIRLD